MNPNPTCEEDPGQILGTLLCLLVIAYIYYFSISQPRTTNSQEQETSQEQILEPIAHPKGGIHFRDEVLKNPLTAEANFLKAYLQFDIHDIRNIKTQLEKLDHELREREKNLERKMEEFARSRIEVEKLMKNWREEQLRTIWDAKRKREGFGGWFKFGASRAAERVADVGNDVEPYSLDEKNR